MKMVQLQRLRLIILLLSTTLGFSLSAEVVNIALSSAPTNLDPLRSTDANSQNINRLLHLSLIDVDETMSFNCRACQSFAESRDEEQHLIHFSLRPDLRFHDGSRVTAHDVKKSWKYFISEENASIFRNAFSAISEIRIHNQEELTLVYDQFAADNLSNLVLLKLLKINEQDEVLGAGPYRLVEQRPLEINISPVEGHFENKKLRDISFKVVRDETTLTLKLINGEIDVSIAQLSPRKERWAMERHGERLQTVRTDGTNFIYLGLNHRSRHLGSLAFREAINHVLPIDKVIRYKLNDSSSRATGMFSNAFSGLSLSAQSARVHDLEKASKLLEGLGYKRDERNRWRDDEGIVRLDWRVANNRSTIEMVEIFRHYLREFGIDVRMTIQEWGTFSRSVRNGQFDIIMGQWVGFTGPEMLATVFHSRSIPPNGANRGHFIDSVFDNLIYQAEENFDPQKRSEYYKKAHQRAFDQLAYIPLWFPDVRWVMNKCMHVEKLYSSGSFLGLLNLKNKCSKND